MKLTIKLNKEEAQAFTNFKKAMVPPEVTEEQFVKTMFFMGLETYHQNMMQMMEEYAKQNPEALKQQGVDIEQVLQDSQADQSVDSPAPSTDDVNEN